MAFAEIDSIHNYFERKVIEEIVERQNEDIFKNLEAEQLSDMACIALNQLAPKYIRHAIDMSFYMSNQERAELEDKVTKAVNFALKRVSK